MTPFDSYRMYYYSAPQYSWDARIDLFNGRKAVATLLFMKAGQAIPANTVNGSIFRLHFGIGHLAEIVALLRYEKPLYVHLNTSNGIGTLATSDEPVGEQEGTGG